VAGLSCPSESKDLDSDCLCSLGILEPRSCTAVATLRAGTDLDRFLMDHFADAIGTWQTPFEGSLNTPGKTVGSSTPMAIASSSLAANTPVRLNAKVAYTPLRTPSTRMKNAAPLGKPGKMADVIQSPAADPRSGHRSTMLLSSLPPDEDVTDGTPQVFTPAVPMAPLPVDANGPVSEQRTLQTPLRNRATTNHLSPGSANRRHSSFSPGTLTSPGGTLLPVHFMRKASESPPVREREKERLGVGRRSILGRDGARESREGNVFRDEVFGLVEV
jgi:hypothetical protein